MDEQTSERMAKLAAHNLTLRDEVKELHRRITHMVPLGAPDRLPVSDPNQAPVAMARIAELEAVVDRLHDEAEAATSDRFATNAAANRLPDVEKRYAQLREDWDAEREETARLQGELDMVTRACAHNLDQNTKLHVLLEESQDRLSTSEGPLGFRSRAEQRLQALETHCFPKEVG